MAPAFPPLMNWLHLFVQLCGGRTFTKMKRNIFRGLILILTSVVCFSCKGPDDPPAKQPGRNQYGRTGNFKGTLYTSYTATAGGSTNNDQVSLVPRYKEITYAPDATAVITALSGGGGIADQQVTVAVKKGGEQLPLLLQQTALEVLQNLHR